MELLRRFIEDAPIGAAMFDRDMRYVAYSPRWLLDHRIDGIPLGQCHYDVFPEIPERWRKVHRRALAGEVVREAEDRFERLEGSVVWLRWEVRPWRDAAGEIGGIIIFTEDITPQKAAEHALQEALNRQRLAQSAGHIAIWDWDLRTGRVYLNDEWYDLFGVPAGAPVTYEDFLARLHPADRPAVETTTRAALAGEGAIEFDCRILRADTGAQRWITSRGEVQFDAGGRSVRAMGTAYDITDRKEMERELREADRRKGEFLATLGHELRNPLTPIKNAINVLQRGADGGGTSAEKMAAILEMAGRQVDHLLHLVDDLLDMTRITHGKIRLRKETCDLVGIIGDAVDQCRAEIAAKRQVLALDLPAQLWLEGDPVRLAQIFANLLGNAARYTDREGRIDMSARREGETAIVTVRDTGAGIAPGMLASIFDMFAQASNDAGARHGLGVGLALARTLVELHGGAIEARSEGIGKGSEFVVRLPAGRAV